LPNSTNGCRIYWVGSFFAFKSKCAKIEFGIRYLWKMEISRNKKTHLFKKERKKEDIEHAPFFSIVSYIGANKLFIYYGLIVF
jgi:hypothetical protein